MGRIRHKSTIGAIGQQVEFLEDCLADQNLITEHQSLFQRVPPHERENDRFGDGDRFRSPVSIFSNTIAARHQAKRLHDVGGDNRSNGARIDHRVSFVVPHCRFLQLFSPVECFVDGVGEQDFDSDFTHGNLRLRDHEIVNGPQVTQPRS